MLGQLKKLTGTMSMMLGPEDQTFVRTICFLLQTEHLTTKHSPDFIEACFQSPSDVWSPC